MQDDSTPEDGVHAAGTQWVRGFDDDMIMVPTDRLGLIFISDHRASYVDEDRFDIASLSARDRALLAALVELVAKKLRPFIGERVL